ETLALHLAGHDADAIAQKRGLVRTTVLGHLAEAIEAGLIEASKAVGLSAEELDEVMAAFERCGTLESGRLGPAHAALDGRYDYGTLKCLLAELA
ncbi:MAG TPA: helix-turn-helix domain-containing protein, partial [Hyphomicrobiaceae bacterium]|nr:helix-turn-helix domain-containing protein [Hyphomicrobiaceae bacterium]